MRIHLFVLLFYCLFIKAQMPNRIWSTYFGGPGVEYISASCLDQNGNLYACGYTSSTVNVASPGAFQANYGGGPHDAFILKFGPSGNLKWATYFGREADDMGTFVVIDKNGNLIISGTTNSYGSMSTAGAHQANFGGGASDAFLAKFDTLGNRIWSTYFGGMGLDESYSCSIDTANNIYLSGNSSSTNAISSPGAYQTVNGGGPNDAFIAKFNANGALQWSTYYGSYGDEQAYGCVCDKAGNLYISGETSSTNSIASPGVLQQTYGGGTYDGFILKLDENGSRQWCTYYGGSMIDIAVGIYFDTLSQNVFVTGFSASNSSISTNGAHQINNGGGDDAWLAKLDTNGNRIWCTYYGGASYERGIAVISDSNFVYLAGLTNSPDNISTNGCFQFMNGYGNGDSYLVKFDKNGNRIWGTYFGGLGYELSTSINLPLASGNIIYLSGISSSSSLATIGSYQFNQNAMDGMLIKFDQSIVTGSGMNQLNETSFFAFPNPNSGEFFIRNAANEEVRIYDQFGSHLQTILMKSSTEKINLNYPDGLLFLLNQKNENFPVLLKH